MASASKAASALAAASAARIAAAFHGLYIQAGLTRLQLAGCCCHYHRYYHACGSIVRAYRLDVPVVHLLVRALAVLERVGLGRKAEHRGREAGVLVWIAKAWQQRVSRHTLAAGRAV